MAEPAEDSAGKVVLVKGVEAGPAIPESGVWAPTLMATMAHRDRKEPMEWTASAAPTGPPDASASNRSKQTARLSPEVSVATGSGITQL